MNTLTNNRSNFSPMFSVARACIVAALMATALLSNATAQSQTEMTQTSQADQTQADAALADFAATYESRLTPDQITLFRLSQTVWDASWQADCAFRASNTEGGSAYPMVVADCLTSAAEAHLTELQTLAGCEEGDLACPAPKLE